MREIEILFEVQNSKKEILSVLKQFEFKGEKETLDIYYSHPDIAKISPFEGKYPQEGLRLRKKGEDFFITYKKGHFKGDEWIYSDEYETKVENHEIMKIILGKLGFEEMIVIDIKKHIYEFQQYELVFEDVKELGLLLEIERISEDDKQNADDVKDKIRVFANSLGLKLKELNMGKPEMLLEKKLRTLNETKNL